jgi:hypothetical protein
MSTESRRTFFSLTEDEQLAIERIEIPHFQRDTRKAARAPRSRRSARTSSMPSSPPSAATTRPRWVSTSSTGGSTTERSGRSTVNNA